jgi:hypothetical protein
LFGATVLQASGASGTLASPCLVPSVFGGSVTGVFEGCGGPVMISSSGTEGALHATTLTRRLAVHVQTKRIKADPTLET